MSKTKFTNKYAFTVCEHKSYLKKIQLKNSHKQQILPKSTSNIFNQDAFSALLFYSFFKIIKQTWQYKILTAPHENIFYLHKKSICINAHS